MTNLSQNISGENRRSRVYGWLVVAVSTMAMAGFYGAALSIGVLFKPLLAEFNWTRVTISGSMSVAEGVAGITGVITGRLTDRYGARTIIAAGGIMGIVGYLLMYKASELWELYTFFGIFAGICIGTCWTPLIATVSRWFREKRMLALGITASGLTIGNMLVPPFVAHYITVYGWRAAYAVLAMIVLIAAIPCIIVIGRRPLHTAEEHHTSGSISGNTERIVPGPGQYRERTGREAIKTPQFHILLITGYVTGAVFYFIAVHIVPYATDAGIAPTTAALVLTVIGGASIVSNVLVWRIANTIGARFTLCMLMALQVCALLLLMHATSLYMLFIAGAIFGFGQGGTVPLRMSMIPEFFGTRSAGVIIGLVGIAWSLGSITGPVLAGLVFDLSQGYDIAFMLAALLTFMGMISALFLRPLPQNTGGMQL